MQLQADKGISCLHESVSYSVIPHNINVSLSCMQGMCGFLTAVSDEWNRVGFSYFPTLLKRGHNYVKNTISIK